MCSRVDSLIKKVSLLSVFDPKTTILMTSLFGDPFGISDWLLLVKILKQATTNQG